MVESVCSNFLQLNNNDNQVTCNVEIIDDDKMRKINLEYRQLDKTTDVLSFPLFDSIEDFEHSLNIFPELELGDIFISFPKARLQAEEFAISVWEEVVHLFFHGFLHLCGIDHEVSLEEEIRMKKLESELIDQLSCLLSN
jgi:probable rRNA maturation factor